jgi:hypothetical protein
VGNASIVTCQMRLLRPLGNQVRQLQTLRKYSVCSTMDISALARSVGGLESLVERLLNQSMAGEIARWEVEDGLGL